ncbi:hypothetical protein B484DRAFT_303473, partial [Ochromonadaceae sp. CCMP2298]
FVMYGDSIFPILSHLRRKHKGHGPVPRTARQMQENEVTKKVRVSIEWNYGITSALWAFCDHRKNNKIQQGGANISNIYIVCTLLTNMHNCLHPNNTSTFFGLSPPSLEVYM